MQSLSLFLPGFALIEVEAEVALTWFLSVTSALVVHRGEGPTVAWKGAKTAVSSAWGSPLISSQSDTGN